MPVHTPQAMRFLFKAVESNCRAINKP